MRGYLIKSFWFLFSLNLLNSAKIILGENSKMVLVKTVLSETFSSGSGGQVSGGRGGRETWILCDRLWWPSFLWLNFTGPVGVWVPPPGSVTDLRSEQRQQSTNLGIFINLFFLLIDLTLWDSVRIVSTQRADQQWESWPERLMSRREFSATTHGKRTVAVTFTDLKLMVQSITFQYLFPF